MNVPTSLQAGDTWEWNESFPAYPASAGWTLSITFYRYGKTPVTVDGVANVDSFDVTVTPDVTKDFAPGEWRYSGRVTGANGNAGKRYSVGEGIVTLRPDYESASATTDLRGEAEAMLGEINAAIRRLSAREVESVTVLGKTVTYKNIDSLIKARNSLMADRQKEIAAENAAMGITTTSLVRTRFGGM